MDEAWGVQDGPGSDDNDAADDGDGDDGEDGSGSPPPAPGPAAPLAIEDRPASLEVDAEEVDAEEVGDAGAESGPANPPLSHEESGGSGGHDVPQRCGSESSSSPMGGASSVADAKSNILAKVEALKTGLQSMGWRQSGALVFLDYGFLGPKKWHLILRYAQINPCRY